jgi:type IV secretory pathway TrbD component
LLIGYVASVVAQGLSLTIAAVFAALWILCTVAAKRVARRRP